MVGIHALTCFSWLSAEDIGNNIIADFMFLLISPLILFFLFQIRQRLRLLRFFGLNQKKTLQVFFSHLNIILRGARDYTGSPNAYQGSALPYNEFDTIPKLESLFGQLFSSQSIIGKILCFIFYRDVKINFKKSPLEMVDPPSSNLILVGGPGYNWFTRHYLDSGKALLKFTNKPSIKIIKGRHKNKEFEININSDTAMLQRFYDEEKKIYIFIAAGAHINGTRGSVEYLVKNWKALYKKFNLKDFAICLRFPQPMFDPEGYKKPTELFEFALSK